MNQALEEDEPIHQYRKMKPPLNRRFDDNKSSVSHEQKTFNQIDSELSRQQNSKKNLKSNSKDELDPLSAMEL